MLFRHAAERSLREVLDAQMVALIAAADPDGPESVTPTALLDTRFDTPGSGPVCGDPLGERREHLALAVDHRHGGAVRPAARRRRAQFLLHRDRRHADPARGREPRHRLGRPARPARALHVQRRLEPRGLRRSRSRASGSSWSAGSRGSRCCSSRRWRCCCAGCRSRCAGSSARSRKWRRARASSSAKNGRSELAPVTSNLNALLDGERTRIQRYRDTLGNLAHSLKTPLAVMRQSLGARRRRQGRARTRRSTA